MSAHLSKTDSEVSSLSQSSPARSDRRQVYYVQSPSRDSHDGEKTTNSFHSTPVLSPMGSPPHSHSNSSLGPHSSRESSSTRLSGSMKPQRKHDGSRKGRKPWKEFDAIEEEGLLDGDGAHQDFHRRRCYFLAFVVGFFVLFTTFSLILWGASRPQKPKITMKSISFNEFRVHAGTDSSGVSTEMVTMNCTVKLTYRNTATFFGVHVTSTPLDLSYSQLTVATGTMRKFYQSRKSQRALTVVMLGSHSCELSLYHSFLELRRIKIRYLDYILSSKTLQLEDCKEACLQNCSCKAILYNGRNKCLLLSQVFSIEKKEGFDSATTFIKVQSSPIFSQSPSRNPSSPNFPQRKRQNTTVIVGSLLGTIFGVFLIFSFLFLRFKNGFQEYEEDYLDNMLGMPTRFSYEELKNVTNNFSNKLGEGGFGSVFRGILPSGSEVAVKHLVGFGPVNKSFTAEVQTIGSIHHFNLVTLVGFCAENSNRLLVYEYMANGSLDQWIFNKNQEPALGWQIRKKIILDIAKGLAYLHEECNQKILHLDIKSQNILLDENFNAKVSDFGLSKLIGRDQSRVVTTMRGTPGYMAPEWLSSVITEKVDVYSFGIVVLEILCGRQNFDSSQQEEDRHLVGLFRRKQEMGQLMDLVDKCSDDMLSNAAEVVEMMKVAAWCLQTEYVRRPSMSIVVKLFEGSVDVVGNMNEEDFLNGLTHEAMETFASTVLPSMLSGPR